MAGQMPDFLKSFAAQSRHLNEASIAGITGMSRPPHIKVNQGRFHVVEANDNSEMLRDFDIEVVIVGVSDKISKLYYGRDFDPADSDPAPPKCFSDNGVAPSVNALEPQHANCAACPHHVWGTGTNGVGRACSDRKKLAVLYEGHLFQLVVPPASLNNYKKFAEFVSNHPEASVNTVITKVSFVEGENGVLQFSPADWISRDGNQLVEEVMKITSAMTVDMLGMNDKPRVAAIAGPVVQPAEPAQSVQGSVSFTAEPKQEEKQQESPFSSGDQPRQRKERSDKGKPRTGNGQQAFGMTETSPVTDAGLKASLNDAMGFLRS